MERESMDFGQKDLEKYEKFTGPLEEGLDKKWKTVIDLSKREFNEIKRLEGENESVFEKYYRPEIKKIEARYGRLRSSLLEKIHNMQLAYLNSNEYIKSDRAEFDQKFFQDAANLIDVLLEELNDVQDGDVLEVCDYEDGHESSWENISAKDFKERILKLKKAYLTKPGEYTSEDVEMLSRYEGYVVEEWRVSKSNEEVELGYESYFDDE